MFASELKATIAKILAHILKSFLEVSIDDIETQLLGDEGRISLRKINFRERKFLVSTLENNVSCYLVISGSSTIEKMELTWKWKHGNAAIFKIADGVLLKNNAVIRGVNLYLSFRYEKQDPDNEAPPAKDRFASTAAENNTFDHKCPATRRKPVRALLKDEMERLKRAAIGNLKETDLYQHIVQNVIDSLGLRIEDAQIELVVPFSNASIKMGIRNFSFASMDAQGMDKNMALSSVDKAELTWNGLHADLHNHDPLCKRGSKHSVITPILEPFTYRIIIRRSQGRRFIDWLHGYEMIGTHPRGDQFQPSGGITIHYSEGTMNAVAKILKIVREKNQKTDYDSEIYNMHQKPPIDEWPVSTKYILVCLSWIFIALNLAMVWTVLRFIGLLHGRKYLTAIFCLASMYPFAAVAMAIAKLDLDVTNQSILKEKEKERQKKRIQNYPAIFRLPFSFVSVVTPDTIQLSLADTTAMGRLDFSKLHVSAQSLTAKSYDGRQRGMDFSMSGVRAKHEKGSWLANIDHTHYFLLPGKFKLEQPLVSSVIAFKDGKLRIEFGYLVVRLLQPDEEVSQSIKVENMSMEKLPEFIAKQVYFKDIAHKVNSTGKVLDAEIQNWLDKVDKGRVTGRKSKPATDEHEMDSRNRMNAEMYEGLFKLQIIASMFEQIPLQKHRQKLRQYPLSFRGRDAVDFVLESNMASTRYEAVKLLKDLEVEFRLFENVTREYKFHDDNNFLYHFVHPDRRRCWKKSELPYHFTENFDRAPQSSPIPFPVVILVNKLQLSRHDNKEGEHLLHARRCELYLDKGKLARAIDGTLLVEDLRSSMLAVANVRVHALVDPEYPKVIHRFQYSVDTLQVNPSFTTQDWLVSLGLDFDTSGDNKSREFRLSDANGSPSEPYLIPYSYIPEFLLKLSWKGSLLSAKETNMKIPGYEGTESTTSNDLIREFVVNVLGKVAGIAMNVNLFGVNVGQSAGIATAIDIGGKFVPFGEYISMGAMVVYDGITSTIDAGKAARNDPTGDWKATDIFHGIFYSAGSLARDGAEFRGKTEDVYYDENDQVCVDPVDYIVGAGHATAIYANKNKARFAGAYVTAAVVIGLGVTLGPIGAITVGILAGAVTERTVEYVEKKIILRIEDEDGEDVDTEENSLSGQSYVGSW